MAVKRWWLFNIPSAGVDSLDRYQFLIGYPANLTPLTSVNGLRIWFPNAPDNADSRADRQEIAIGIPVFHIPTGAVNFDDYLRRYLDDPLAVVPIGPALTPVSVAEDANTLYIRRYLGDPA